MKNCTVEILMILNKKSSLGKTPAAYKKTLEATDEIEFLDNSILFNKLAFDFYISEHGTNKDTYFIKIVLNDVNDENLMVFSKLLRTIKKISHENNLGSVQIIWDDISKYYSTLAYPIIHEIENLMRKLITKFMLNNVGLSWVKNSIPEEFARSLDKSKKQSNNDIQDEHNIMYQVDFIQLSNFLFNAYRELDISELIKKLAPLSFEQLDIKTFAEIKKIIPQTNWDKYFKSSISVNSDTIITDWKTLYDLRCCVAHNRDFTKKNLDDVIALTKKLNPIIKNAIDSTEDLIVNTQDKTELINQYEDSFKDDNKTDEQLYKDAILRLFYALKELYEKTFEEEMPNDSSVKDTIEKIFAHALQNQKYNSSDTMHLISYITENGKLNQCDNFEIHELIKESDLIREMVIDKLTEIETAKNITK